jgi:hypothetical protein
MSISIKLLDSVRSIEKKVNAAIAKQANSITSKNDQPSRRKIYSFVYGCIQEQPEIASLRSGGQGSLAAQFGIPAGQESSVVDSIVAAIVAATRVNISRFNRNLQGKIDISFQPASFDNLFSLHVGSVHTELGVNLDWLRWLLQEGNRVIIIGYEYVSSSRGRSKGGIMKTGESWRVPTQFSGTADDNFITRAFANREKELQGLLGSFLGSKF